MIENKDTVPLLMHLLSHSDQWGKGGGGVKIMEKTAHFQKNLKWGWGNKMGRGDTEENKVKKGRKCEKIRF